ncbi:hypothetical protein NBRC116589_40680 [Ruegeria sp. HU-ET01832]
MESAQYLLCGTFLTFAAHRTKVSFQEIELFLDPLCAASAAMIANINTPTRRMAKLSFQATKSGVRRLLPIILPKNRFPLFFERVRICKGGIKTHDT